MESHRAGDTVKSGSLLHRAVGKCPCAEVRVGSGMVELSFGSTITESFFNQHLAQENNLVDVGQFIRISAANGLEIPYIGYVELDVSTLDHMYPNLGFLVVKDPRDGAMTSRKHSVPGVIGSNIFRDTTDHLKATRGVQFLQTLKYADVGEWGSILHSPFTLPIDEGFGDIGEAVQLSSYGWSKSDIGSGT